MIESSGPEAAAAYAAAAAAADPEVAADIDAVAAASAALTPAMVAAFSAIDSVDDLATLEQAFSSPELLAAARSGRGRGGSRSTASPRRSAASRSD